MLDDLQNKMTDRREALKTFAKGAGYFALGGAFWGMLIDEVEDKPVFVLRPPGAIDEKKFVKACIKCGQCVQACPYDTLSLAQPSEDFEVGTPFFEPRKIPCYMCTDIPCVPVCPTGALDIKTLLTTEGVNKGKLDVNKSRMGLAVVHNETCVAHWGIQCDACYRACPLMDVAIKLHYESNERTGKHAYLTPEVSSDACTGCGLCERACITEKPAIRVLPLDFATGAVGSHYQKGWENGQETLVAVEEEKPENNETSQETLDYLNNTDELLNDE